MKLKYFVVLLCAALLATTAFAQTKKKMDKQTMEWRYEIEPAAGQGAQGTYLVKVWSYAKKADKAIAQAPKNAVHGVLFKGYAAYNNGNTRIAGQKAIVTDPAVESQQEAFFQEFFADGGNYAKYVSLVGNGSPDIIKVGKEYKVGVVVSVQKDALRKDLEAAGVIKSMGGMF